MKNVLLYGGGTQSTGLLLMSLDGLVPKLDLAIFSDTFSEPGFVYEYMNKVSAYVLSKYGFKIVTVEHGNLERNLEESAKSGKRVASLPYYTENGGMTMRQCTADYKINPASKFIKAYFNIGRKKKHSAPTINRWFGMSLDEIERMRVSQDWWAVNEYPLIMERMYRHEVINYINNNHPELKNPPRSACYFCPFHSNDYWRLLKKHHPDEFNKACIMDGKIRVCRNMENERYLHRSMKPLSDINFEKDNYEIFAECEGYCGM